MLPLALKLVWFVLTIVGTFFSFLSVTALGRLVGTRWAPVSYNVGLFIYQGMFCFGIIWRMDPYRMPRAFCLAQTIGMSLGFYIIGGSCLAFCIAISLHILRPKQWGDISKSWTWRPVYYLPIIGFPLVSLTVRILLIVKYDAVQPFEGLCCDAAAPVLVRIAGPAVPAVLIIPPTLYLSVISGLHIIRTLRHVERAQRDDTELRQIRRDRPSGPLVFKQSGVVPHEGDPESHSPVSASFPTFAPMDNKHVSPPHQTDETAGTESPKWMQEDTGVATSNGQEPPEALELDDGTFRLSYREHARTPTKISHVYAIPLLAPQIRRLLLCQVVFPISMITIIACIVADDLTHPTKPRPIGFMDVVQLSVAWMGAIAFGTLRSIRIETCNLFMFWKR
ncbi:hypothetical protein K438DRAFT_1936413 [Mycena galopus ATCC 62051]|nr:hypothetical protein K438DRAFT_1936413 [Mycena galopus ATCC 62051]